MLASTSSSRVALIRRAGIDPIVVPPLVDESVVSAPSSAQLVAALARMKCDAVGGAAYYGPEDLILGCDTVMQHGSKVIGKPRTAGEVRDLLRSYSNKWIECVTGHYLLRPHIGSAERIVTTAIHVETLDMHDIESYIESGEPYGAAGGIKLNGIGGLFISEVAGDPLAVEGLSLSAVREMLRELKTDWSVLVRSRDQRA